MAKFISSIKTVTPCHFIIIPKRRINDDVEEEEEDADG